MKLGIMQPYFMPYIGYWQLMNIVDKYVIYDDVNYIKGGWINRNRILINNQVKYFNVQMEGASPNKLINQVSVTNNRKILEKDLRILEAAYSKAPYFKEVLPLMKSIILSGETNLALFIKKSFEVVCEYLSIDTEFVLSSDLNKNDALRSKEKIFEICKILEADEYYNAIGGQELYSFKDFDNQGIKLKFIKTENIEYKQFNNEFYPNLSIIDVLMFNSVQDIKKYLNEYRIIEG